MHTFVMIFTKFFRAATTAMVRSRKGIWLYMLQSLVKMYVGIQHALSAALVKNSWLILYMVVMPSSSYVKDIMQKKFVQDVLPVMR